MLKGRPLQARDIIDGFRLDEHSEPGGMADFWRVSHAGISLPLIVRFRCCAVASTRSTS